MAYRNFQQEPNGFWLFDAPTENAQEQNINHSSRSNIHTPSNNHQRAPSDLLNRQLPHPSPQAMSNAQGDFDMFADPDLQEIVHNSTPSRSSIDETSNDSRRTFGDCNRQDSAHTTKPAASNAQESYDWWTNPVPIGSVPNFTTDSSSIREATSNMNWIPRNDDPRQSPRTATSIVPETQEDDWATNKDLQETLFNSARDKAAISVPQLPLTPKRTAPLDARIEELQVTLPWVHGNRGCDTIVYIDPPVIHDTCNWEHLNAVRSHFKEGSHIKSSSLRKLQSPRFDRMLEEKYQSLLRKKRQIKHLPPGIGYVIDLTPRIEGEEAVEALMRMSCSLGILEWPESHLRWDVGELLVLGRDELSEEFFSNKRRRSEDIPRESHRTDNAEQNSRNPVSNSTNEKDPPQEKTLPPAEPEYTGLRHRLAIERFLLALENQDPKLDSASKVYTAVKVSQAFEIYGHNPLTDYVARWLYAEPNSRFIEALPEETIKIADALRNGPFAIDAFSILVGEAVLDSATNHDPSSTKTFLDRRRGSVDEIWQSRIEYARNSLKERVEGIFENLAGEHMSWIEKLPVLEWIKSTGSNETKEWKDSLQGLLRLIKDYVRGAIYHIMCSTYLFKSKVTGANDKAGGDSLYPRDFVQGSWNKTLPQSRIFLKSFWEALSNLSLRTNSAMNSTSVFTFGENDTNISLTGISHERQGFSENSADLLGTSLCKEVKYYDLAMAVQKCRSPLASAERNSVLGLYCEKRGCSRCTQNVNTCRSCFRHLCLTHLPRMKHECNLQEDNLLPDLEYKFPPSTEAPSSTSQTELPHRPLYTGNLAFNLSDRATEPLASLPLIGPKRLYDAQNSDPFGTRTQLRSGNEKKRDIELEKTQNERLEPTLERGQHLTGKPGPLETPKSGSSLQAPKWFRKLQGEQETLGNGKLYNQKILLDEDLMIKLETPASQNKRETNLDAERSADNAQFPPSYESIYAYQRTPNADSVSVSENEQPPPPKYSFSPWTTYGVKPTTMLTMGRLMKEIQDYVQAVGNSLSGPAIGSQIGDMFELTLTQTLTCLAEEETNFLPLWAGGCDDGTNGVFNGAVPFADDGFRGPPATTNEFAVNGIGGEYDAMDDGRTIATSAMANDGYGDTLRRAHVYAVSEIESVDWTDVRDRTAKQNPVPRAASAEEDMGVISESGIATPTATTAKKDLDLDVLDDAFMDFPSDEEDDGDDIGSPGSGEVDEVGDAERDNEDERLETDSVSFCGISESEYWSVLNVSSAEASSRKAEASQQASQALSVGPRANLGSQSISTQYGGSTRPVANTVADELKSLDANTWIIYKDGPEDDLLTRT